MPAPIMHIGAGIFHFRSAMVAIRGVRGDFLPVANVRAMVRTVYINRRTVRLPLVK